MERGVPVGGQRHLHVLDFRHGEALGDGDGARLAGQVSQRGAGQGTANTDELYVFSINTLFLLCCLGTALQVRALPVRTRSKAR